MSDDMLDQRTRQRLEDLLDIVEQDAKLIQNLRKDNGNLRSHLTALVNAVCVTKKAASYNRHKREHCISQSIWSALSDQEKYSRSALEGVTGPVSNKGPDERLR